MLLTSRPSSQHSSSVNIVPWELPPHLDSESSDIVLHLAGVNEYRGLRVVGDARWKAFGNYSYQFDLPRK